MHNRDPRRRRKRKGDQNAFDEIMAENFPNLKKKRDTHVQEAERFPNKMNLSRPTPRHMIIKNGKS